MNISPRFLNRTLTEKDPWHPRTIRIFRNGDRFFSGYDYTFKPGRDVLNMEGLCDKVSDRIGEGLTHLCA